MKNNRREKGGVRSLSYMTVSVALFVLGFVITVVLLVLSVFNLLFVNTGDVLLSVGVFSALGFGTCMSVGLAVIGRDSGGEKAAPGIATFYLLCDFGCGIGPFLLGFVTGSLGYPAMYICCSIVAALGVAYYHFSHGRSHRGGAPTDE